MNEHDQQRMFDLADDYMSRWIAAGAHFSAELCDLALTEARKDLDL